MQAEQQHMGKGRFWGSHATSPSPDMPTQPKHGTASRPTLKRQNAFKLSEEESQALTQQFGLSSHGHSGSGHDLLSAASEESTQAVVHARQADSRAAVTSDGVLSSVKGGPLEGALPGATEPTTSFSPVPDLHQPFNATSAYANVTRCNPKRWVALHTSGALQCKPSRKQPTPLHQGLAGVGCCKWHWNTLQSYVRVHYYNIAKSAFSSRPGGM